MFFSGQLKVQHEGTWFHWVTNRALRELEGQGTIRTETRPLTHGGDVHLMWHPRNRYFRREAARVVRLSRSTHIRPSVEPSDIRASTSTPVPSTSGPNRSARGPTFCL